MTLQTILSDDTSIRTPQASCNPNTSLSQRVGFKWLFVDLFVSKYFMIKDLNFKTSHMIFFCADMCSIGHHFKKSKPVLFILKFYCSLTTLHLHPISPYLMTSASDVRNTLAATVFTLTAFSTLTLMLCRLEWAWK